MTLHLRSRNSPQRFGQAPSNWVGSPYHSDVATPCRLAAVSPMGIIKQALCKYPLAAIWTAQSLLFVLGVKLLHNSVVCYWTAAAVIAVSRAALSVTTAGTVCDAASEAQLCYFLGVAA